MNTAQDKRRRDWSIIIFILPLGVAMMMCVGQQAIRMSPSWSVNGDMNSSLDPETAPKQNALVVPPISSDILTPVTWWDTFLTPMSDDSNGGIVLFPPFITFEPSASPTTTATASPTSSSLTVTTTPVVTGTTPPPSTTPTKKPTDSTTPTPPTATSTSTVTSTTTITSTSTSSATPATCSDPLANNNGLPLPCVYTPTPPATCSDPLANNNGLPLPCVYTPTPAPTCAAPGANNNGGPLPCIFPVSSTPSGTQTAAPPQVTVGTPDGNIGSGIPDGYYIVLTLPTPIVVNGPSDTNYDMAYYERPAASGVDMDSVIVSISMDNVIYYVVLNWGDNQPNSHTNVDVNNLPTPPPGCTDLECDNQHIDASDLHDPPGGPAFGTGILIDVDNAPSNPPPGDYWYIAVEAPSPTVNNDGADVDSIEIVDIAPTP